MKAWKFYLLPILCLPLQLFAQRAVCPPDTIWYARQKATEIDTIAFNPILTNAAYQYFSCPQEIEIGGARFYGYKPDTAGGNTVTITVEIRRANSDSVPGNLLYASQEVIIDIPDSLDGPLSAYGVDVTWSPVVVDEPYTVVISADPLGPGFTLLHNKLATSNGDGNEEWLSGVLQGASWIRSYDFAPGGVTFDADFLFEPFVEYNLDAEFVNDPECLFDELGEWVQFENTGAAIADDPMYNRYAFFGSQNGQRWTFGDGTPLTYDVNPVHFYPTNGPFVATMTSHILNWTYDVCESSVTQIIKEKPAQDFSFVTNNLTVDFTNETFGLYSSISWDFGDGNSSVSEDPKHKYAAPGTYWVCQTMQTSCGEIVKCRNVAVATNTALNCGKDSVRYTAARATDIKTIRLKNTAPSRLMGVGQIFDATQPMIVHGFSFYGNHEGLFKDSYPVTCSLFKKGTNKLPEGPAVGTTTVHINKEAVDTNYSDTVRYTAIFDVPVNLDYDYILTIEYDSNVPVHISTSDWIEGDGDGDLLAIGKINDTTWVTAASVAVFNVDGVAFNADIIAEPLVEYNLDANFTYDFECFDPDNGPALFEEASSEILRNKIYNTLPFYTSSVQAFDWYFGDGTDTTSQLTPSHNFIGDGPYDVTLTVTLDGWTNDCQNTQVHRIYAHPTGGFTHLQVLSKVVFTDTSRNAEEHYWEFSDGMNIYAENVTRYFLDTGTFEACQYVSNECGSDTHCVDIEVLILDVPEALRSSLSLYPNPAQNQLTVDATSLVAEAVGYELVDLGGRTLLNGNLRGGALTNVDLSFVSDGAYLMRLSAEGYSIVKPIVVAK